MAIRAYVGECMVYRTVGMIEDGLSTVDRNNSEEVLRAIEEYAIECSIIKVAGSETLNFCADEAVQVFGGNGYSKDYPVERAYRDARINRLFEGTNEINRLLIPGMLFRRAQKGRLDLFTAAQKVAAELLAPAAGNGEGGGPMGDERRLVEAARKATLFAAGAAVQKYLMDLEHQQEILGDIANLVIDLFAAESAVLRAAKTAARGGPSAGLPLGNSARHMANATLDWQASDRLSLFLSAELRSRRYRGVDAASGEPQYWKDYEVFHLGASYRFAEWVTLNARINNLLDRDFTRYQYAFLDNNDGSWTLSAQDDYNNKDKARNVWVSVNFSF